MLRTLSVELGGSSRDIQALSTTTLCSPHLRQLTITSAPQWRPLVRFILREPRQPIAKLFGMLPEVVQEQLRATQACLQVLSRQAPNICALSAIEGGSLHTILPSFPKLAHLVLDLWVPSLNIDWVHELGDLETECACEAPLVTPKGRWVAAGPTTLDRPPALLCHGSPTFKGASACPVPASYWGHR